MYASDVSVLRFQYAIFCMMMYKDVSIIEARFDFIKLLSL